jgi:hypothetical protein
MKPMLSPTTARQSWTVGEEAARFRAGHEVAVQQHELRDRRRDCREGRWAAVLSVLQQNIFKPLNMTASWTSISHD